MKANSLLYVYNTKYVVAMVTVQRKLAKICMLLITKDEYHTSSQGSEVILGLKIDIAGQIFPM